MKCNYDALVATVKQSSGRVQAKRVVAAFEAAVDTYQAMPFDQSKAIAVTAVIQQFRSNRARYRMHYSSNLRTVRISFNGAHDLAQAYSTDRFGASVGHELGHVAHGDLLPHKNREEIGLRNIIVEGVAMTAGCRIAPANGQLLFGDGDFTSANPVVRNAILTFAKIPDLSTYEKFVGDESDLSNKEHVIGSVLVDAFAADSGRTIDGLMTTPFKEYQSFFFDRLVPALMAE